MKKIIFSLFLIPCFLQGNYSKEVPKDVINKIISSAEQRWGTDYQMINYTVKNEVEAYWKYKQLKEVQEKINKE